MTGWSTPIPDEQAGEVLRWYEGLEEQTMDFIRVVPPHGTNLQVWSSKIATILVEACCLIESVFHHFRDDAAAAQGKPKLRDYLRLGDYAALYNSLLRLPDRTAVLLKDVPEYRRPFAVWTDLLNGAPFERAKHVPEWWNLYNRSKHRRITVFPEFTLTMAIDTLAGALVIISTVPAFAPAMLRHEWLNSAGANPEHLVRDYWQTLRGQKSTPQEWPFTIDTQLFAFPIGCEQLPADISNFRPILYGASPRLLRWFRKF